uniref:Succinate dehydrogenase [ubiquinone] cytochrome b small subunit n=1 Tax=Panagrellus redivivus TaxID=6233 RepID=A0A7E4VUN3_PANRE
MSLSRAALPMLRLRASALAASAVAPRQIRLSTTDVTPGKPMGHNAQHFKLERYFAAAMVPLLPASYFIHGTAMDFVLSTAVALHIHWGIVAVVNDYGRPIVIGEKAAKLAVPFAYVLSILLFAGLLHFNTNDVGLTRAFELVFSL